MFDRIQIRDAERIGDQRSGARTAARADRHAVLARPTDEIGDDQEISGESHGADDAKLQIEPRLVSRDRPRRCGHRGRRGRAGGLQAAPGFRAQELFGARPGWNRVRRQHGGAQANFQ